MFADEFSIEAHKVSAFKMTQIKESHMTSVEGVEDIIDADDESHDVSKAYDEQSWPSEEPTGFRFRGKARSFRKAVENIKILMKKSKQSFINEIQIRVLDSRKIPHGSEAEIEICKDNEKGAAIMKIFGPNKKKEYTICVTKAKKCDNLYVNVLAKDIIKPLLNSFISGEGWSKLVRSVQNQKLAESNFKCKVCSISFLTSQLLKDHLHEKHEAQTLTKCEDCDYTGKNVNDLEAHILTMHAIFPMDVDTSVYSDVTSVKPVDQKEDTVKDMIIDDYDVVYTNLPENVLHLVNPDDVQFVIPSDGACGSGCGAAHILNNHKAGPKLRKTLNNHMVENWWFYKEKISFPYERKVGVSGKVVKLQNEHMLCKFLRTEEASYLWSDCEDLLAMCNLYQMNIKVISITDVEDKHPDVYMLGPDEALEDQKIVSKGTISNMLLLHYKNKHFNLVVNKDSPLIKANRSKKYEVKEDLRYEALEAQLSNSLHEIKCLKEKLSTLEKRTLEIEKNISHTDANPIKQTKELPENLITCTKSDSKSPSPQDLSIHITPRHSEPEQFNCMNCSFQGTSQDELRNHVKLAHTAKNHTEKFNCHTCGEKFATKSTLMKHRKENHANIVRKCKFYIQGTCAYIDSLCWYIHEEKNTTEQGTDSSQSQENFKCKFCEKLHVSKHDLMLHRKQEHVTVVSKCRAYQNSTCNNDDENCWFIHALENDKVDNQEQTVNNEASVVFQKPSDLKKPPDFLMKMEEVVTSVKMIADQMEKMSMYMVENKAQK